MLNLHGSAIIVQHGSRRSTRACAHPVTFSKRHGRPATCQAAQVESVSSREDVARHMIGIEKSLPGMSLSQLANAFSSCVHTYRAASLSQLAMSCSDELFVGVVDYFTNELPDQSWLLTFRAAVAKHLSNHPAVLSDTLAAVRAAPVSTAAQHGASAASHTYYSPCQLQHEHLAQILRGLAALPIMVVQPLPIGFGTPRWYRPLAAADPAAWEFWLADLAAVYTALLQEQHQQLHQQLSHQHQPRYSDSSLNISHSDLGSFIAAAAAAGRDSWCTPGLGPIRDCRHLQEYCIEHLADFMIHLACCMRWSNVNVDDDRLQTQDFKDKVLSCLQQQVKPRCLQPVQHQQSQPLHSNDMTRPATPEPQWDSSSSVEDPSVPQGLAVSEQELALAGSFMHRVTYSMLLLLLPPPRPMLSAFFDATAERLPDLFTLSELRGLVRGLLYLGAVPSEPWLKSLVAVVRVRVQDLAPKEVQGFVEGFRFFGTKARKAGWLRDATAQLEEFTLC